MKLFTVESILTFHEVHIVQADSEEEAKTIAAKADYNASNYLGQQVMSVSEFDKADMPRLKKVDTYFYKGYSCLNPEDGSVFYKTLDTESTKEEIK